MYSFAVSHDRIALDQNFSNQGSMNYVNVSVPSDITLSKTLERYRTVDRNYYSTVSLPQNIVGSIEVLLIVRFNVSNLKNPYLLCMFTPQITCLTRV